MAQEIILSKDSSKNEIKAYFNAVLELSQSDNQCKGYFADTSVDVPQPSIRNYKKTRRDESKLDIAERNHFLDKIYNIISNMVRETKAA